jgi:hypothetical protein
MASEFSSMGIYEAETAEAAYIAMLRDAGYITENDRKALEETCGGIEEMYIEELFGIENLFEENEG